MSGSPKYTTVAFEEQRRAQLEAARQRREAERRQREEAQRQRRIQAAVLAGEQRAAKLNAQLQVLERRCAQLSQRDEVAREVANLATLITGIRTTNDESGLNRLNKALRSTERRTDKLAVAIARELTLREHASAVDTVVDQLDTVTNRDVHDAEGQRAVAALVSEARRRVGDPKQFPGAYARLANGVTEHLDRVRDRLAVLQRLTAESDEVATRLTAVLDDAKAAGVEVADLDKLNAALTDLQAESDGRNVTRWEHRLGALRRATDAVSATVDARLDEMERMAIIVEAASAALPAAGLRVVPDSLGEIGGAVRFRAERVDGSSVELTVHAGDGRGTRLEYRTDADDVIVETTVDGEVRTCDLTEQLLERFHAALVEQGVRADGLHWVGKPERPRPPGSAARQVTAPDHRSLR